APARLVGDLSPGVYHRRAAGPRRGRPRPHHPAGAWAPARWPPLADGAPRAPRGAGHTQGGDPMSPRRSVGRDAPGTSTRRQVRRARAPYGMRHATASHRGRHDRIAVSTARVQSQGVTTMGRRANKHILLTGGNSGIDREGARVAVKLEHVTRTYRRDAFEVRALDDVSLTIPTQGFVAIMGPSGSGKTTLLNLVAGIDHATSGSVVVGEAEITTMHERALAAWRARHIGLVFQFYNLIPVLTAFENVELPLLLTHLSKAERKTHVASALKAVGLADRMEHYPRQLSGGQEQRVA